MELQPGAPCNLNPPLKSLLKGQMKNLDLYKIEFSRVAGVGQSV